MKRFVIGDIHGGHKALLQCLERSRFDRQNDLLISLGDVCDGWPEVHKVIDELLRMRYVKAILGNHDEWALRWMKEGWQETIWTDQGGAATLESYYGTLQSVPKTHLHFLESAPLFLELDNKLFVHGGFDPESDLLNQSAETLVWDRDLLRGAVESAATGAPKKFGKWDDIFVGHTPTMNFGSSKPLHVCNVWALDTGAGWGGEPTIMDIDTCQYWQSDPLSLLYPHVSPRHR